MAGLPAGLVAVSDYGTGAGVLFGCVQLTLESAYKTKKSIQTCPPEAGHPPGSTRTTALWIQAAPNAVQREIARSR